jgi:hypothetical protein
VTLDKFISLAQPLSLTARACISLHITEAYFRKIGLKHALVDEFFDHLWDHPLQCEPKEFSAWEAKRGDFVDFGLTDDLPDDLDEVMPQLPSMRQNSSQSSKLPWKSSGGISSARPMTQPRSTTSSFHSV